MSIRDLKGTVEDKIPIKHVIVSVSDKNGLEEFIPGLIEVSPDVRFISTGGTYGRLMEILGNPSKSRLISVEDYTGVPEMQGGLVKTLHPKVHAGILGERNNETHQNQLVMNFDGAVYIDMVVVNLYPFEDIISQEGVTFEQARGNIDIGGPTMLRGAAKNYPSCAAVCDPSDYTGLLSKIKENDGCTTFTQRLNLAKKVFAVTEKYEKAIRDHFADVIHNDLNGIMACYEFSGGD